MRSNALSFISACLALSLAPLASRALTQGDYTYTVTNGHATITDFNAAYSGALSITNTLGGFPVTGIGDGAFIHCHSLTSVTFPDSVITVGNEAFAGWNGDEWIDIFDEEAFFFFTSRNFIGRTNLTSVTLGNGTTTIGAWAFAECTGLTGVAIPNSVTNIGQGAFYTCTSLTDIIIPDSITGLGESAFSWCTNLTNVTIGNGLASIGTNAFSCCRKLASVTIPDTVTNIGYCAFSECSGLTNLIIPSSVTIIGNWAFQSCVGLYSVTIPDNVTTLGNCTFAGCISLTSVLFTGNAPTFGSNVFSSSPATIYYFPGTTGWGDTFAGRPAVCWNPSVSPASPPRFASGAFGFTLTGNSNIPVRVEACTNLSDGVWSTVTNATLGTEGSLQFSDPTSTNLPARFYRLCWP